MDNSIVLDPVVCNATIQGGFAALRRRPERRSVPGGRTGPGRQHAACDLQVSVPARQRSRRLSGLGRIRRRHTGFRSDRRLDRLVARHGGADAAAVAEQRHRLDLRRRRYSICLRARSPSRCHDLQAGRPQGPASRSVAADGLDRPGSQPLPRPWRQADHARTDVGLRAEPPMPASAISRTSSANSGRQRRWNSQGLYTAPGVDHVGSGAPANVDMLGVLVDWVEKRQRASRSRSHRAEVGGARVCCRRALPLCRWPAWPHYKGGDSGVRRASNARNKAGDGLTLMEIRSRRSPCRRPATPRRFPPRS